MGTNENKPDMETIADIVREMREAAKSTDLFNGEEVGEPLIRGTKVEEWADRIDAAAERERASLEDALVHCRQYAQKIERENEEGETLLDAEEIIATVDNEFAGIRPARATGNAAAMREALQNLCDCTSCDWACIGRTGFDPLNESCLHCTGRPERNDDCPWKMARAALAAPARNCDVGTAEEQAHRFHAFCSDNTSEIEGMCYSTCPCIDCADKCHCLCVWSQMPFVPAKGGKE